MTNTNFFRRGFIFFIYCFFVCHFANPQSVNNSFNNDVFKTATATTKAGSSQDYLYYVSDTAVQLSPRLITSHDALSATISPSKTFNYIDVSSMAVARKHTVLKGAAFGALTGALVGLITYKKRTGAFALDFGPGANAALGAVIGIPVGLLVGFIVREKN